MSAISQALSAEANPQDLQLGPLHYRLVAHDAWGQAVITDLHRYFPAASAEQPPNRVIHLQRLPDHGCAAIGNSFLSRACRTIFPDGAAGFNWQMYRNVLNTVWHSGQSCHALWAAPADACLGTLRFHLPWNLLLHDLAKLGGGLIHGGAALHTGRAWLFLAPPGGGKSTTLATAPPDWWVLSDDAALLWPDQDGLWQIFPLLSWSSMLTPVGAGHDAVPLARQPSRVAGLLLLHKAEAICLERMPPITAAPALYRALHEYPINIFAGNPHLEQCFRTAAKLALSLPCWRLDLPLGGNIWPGLHSLAGAGA